MKRLAMTATSRNIIIHCIKHYSKRDLCILCFFIISSVLTFYLGIWQLNKGLSAQNIKATKKIMQLQGTWQSKYLLLDNRTHNTVAGYWVFIPFQDMKTAIHYWVRIGFLPYQYRNNLDFPNQFDFIDGKLTHIKIQALDWINPVVWKENHIEKLGSNIIRIQKLNQTTLPKSMQLFENTSSHKMYFDSIMTLVSDIPAGFYKPKIPNIIKKAHKHFGYALQWFLLSCIPLVFFIRFIIKPERYL